jgi:hypothetical protein
MREWHAQTNANVSGAQKRRTAIVASRSWRVTAIASVDAACRGAER